MNTPIVHWIERFNGVPSQRQFDSFEAWAEGRPKPTDDFHSEKIDRVSDLEMEVELKKAVSDENAIVSVSKLYSQWIPIVQNAKCTFRMLAIVPDRQKAWDRTHRVLKGLKIHSLHMKGSTQVSFHDCWIGELSIDDGRLHLTFKDTWVRSLVIRDSIVSSLQWDNGYLGTASIPNATNIQGDLRFRRLYLNRDRSKHGIQWLRDIRATLVERHNLIAASEFHAVELALNRDDEQFLTRVVSRIYELGSNFGNSIGKPLLWLGVFFLCILVVAILGGTQANPEAAVGWHKRLDSPTQAAEWLRAGVYAANSIFNPLNILVSKPLVTASYWGGAVVCSILGIMGTISFALFLLSIRRRFKLE